MQPTLPAHLLIQNVNVLTMDPNRPFASGVAIADGKIIGILDKETNWPLSPQGKIVDGNGLTLMPGLIDAHCHLRAQISQMSALSFSRADITGIDEMILAIREKTRTLPNGTWIRGTGYDPFYLKEKRHPTRWDLDQATTHHPIRLRHITRHASVLNSLALNMAGLNEFSQDPPGVKVERQPDTNIPTGVIYGGDSWLSQHVIPPITTSELENGSGQLQRNLLQRGITAVQDATPTSSIQDVKFWTARIQENKWPITIQLMASAIQHQQMEKHLINETNHQVRKGLEIGPIKVVLEANPDLFPAPTELTQIVVNATAKNIPVAIHVVDPEMVWAAVDAIETARSKFPNNLVRHRLEHLSLCPDAFLPAISKARIMVVTNPSFIYQHGDRYLSDVDPTERNWLYPMNSVLQSKIPLAAGSDAPVAVSDPWMGIQTACTRETLSGMLVNQHEKLDRYQALSLYTVGAALAAGWQHKRGMIHPQFEADLILIDQNPLNCPEREINKIQVKKVWIGGNLVFQS